MALLHQGHDRFCGQGIVLYRRHGSAEFTNSGITYDAVLRNLELIGEAATHVPESVRKRHGDIPWRMMIATRNRLIHAYLGIDDDIVWSIVRDDIPELRKALNQLLQDI